MRNALLLALLASAASFATACVPFGCGGYSGGNDRVLARGADSMILCENGGFVVNLASSQLEGRYADDAQDSTIVRGTLQNTDVLAFTLAENADGTSVAPQLGAGTWTDVTLDQVAIDHANTQCTNLEARAWWNEAAPNSDSAPLQNSAQMQAK